MELYFYVPDLHLLSITELRADSTLRQLLVNFHRRTRDFLPSRTLSNFLKMPDGDFLLSSQEGIAPSGQAYGDSKECIGASGVFLAAIRTTRTCVGWLFLTTVAVLSVHPSLKIVRFYFPSKDVDLNLFGAPSPRTHMAEFKKSDAEII